MRLVFGPDDETAFERARDELTERFGRAAPNDDERQFVAELAFDWKWGYGDGDLGRWRLEDVDDFLLEWCPRKVTMSGEDAATLPASLSDLLGFLGAEGLLAAGSTPLGRLQAHLDGLGDRVVAAMTDRSRFGMAKSLFSSMADVGLAPDITDPASVQDSMDRFNALPFDERGRILGLPDPFGSPWEQLTAAIPLPPAPSPPDQELAALAEAAPIMSQVRLIRDFVAGGRKLTAKGNLTVADAKALAAQLGDRSLALYAEMSFTIRSADDLHQTQFLLRWARAAGAVRVAKGKMLVTGSWAKMDAVERLRRAVSALLDKGPVALRTADNQWAPHALIELIDEGAVHLLAVLWAMAEPADFEDLLEAVAEVCEQQLRFSAVVTPDSRRRSIRTEVDSLFDLLAMAGVVVREETRTVTDQYGVERREGGTLSLTLLGRAVLGDYLDDHGYAIPEAGELSDRPLSVLFDRIGEWHPDQIRAEFDSWVQHHSPEAAIDEMAVLLDGYADPQWPVAAFDLAERLGSPAAARAARRFVDTAARGHAIGWLLEHGHHDVPDDPPAMLRAGVELLATGAEADRDDEFLGVVESIDDLGTFIEQVCLVPGPPAAVVLAGIARVHPDPAIANAARKAGLQMGTAGVRSPR